MDLKIWELFYNPTAVGAVGAMLSVQVSKIFQPILKGEKPDIKLLSKYGGMPSGHAAFLSSAAVGVALSKGWASSEFGFAAVATAYLIYEILNLRPAVESHQTAVKTLAEKTGAEIKTSQYKSHTVAEVIIGILWGIACAVLSAWLFRLG